MTCYKLYRAINGSHLGDRAIVEVNTAGLSLYWRIVCQCCSGTGRHEARDCDVCKGTGEFKIQT